MELRQLEYFVAVAEERSFTLGARRVHVVQSAASAAVARLEAELDVTLLVRSAHGIELTDAGRIVLHRARSMLVDVRTLHDELAALRGGIAGTIRLGTLFTTGTIDLAAALAGFRQHHPAVTVMSRVTSGAWAEHARGVRDGTLDLAILPLGDPPQDLDVRPIGSARLVLVGPADGRHVPRGRVGIEQLRDVPFIDFPEGWGNREMTDRLFADAAVTRTVAIEVSAIDPAIAMVRGGLGLAFLPEHVPSTHADLRVVALDRELPAVPVAVVTARDRELSAAARALIEQLLASAHD